MNVYQIITERIIKKLEEGVIPWRKPWKGEKINYVSRKPYRGINLFLLDRPGEYLTWNQINKLGGKVKKGAKSEIVVFYKPLEKIEEREDVKTGEIKEVKRIIPLLRYYRVFHIEDIEGIESKLNYNENINPLEEGEKIINGYKDKLNGFEIRLNDRAYYSITEDKIVVPELKQFDNPAKYYSTVFHEMAHSTGYWTRLKRFKPGEGHLFGSESYSKEELIAEIASCMLCSIAGIETEDSFENSASYIASWLKVLKNDKRLIVQASNEAQKAVDYILGVQENDNIEEEDYKESA